MPGQSYCFGHVYARNADLEREERAAALCVPDGERVDRFERRFEVHRAFGSAGWRDVMPGSSFVTVTPLNEIVDVHRRSWILGARVFTVFGLLALVLAAVGLYSVIAYNVAQRRHELGVRLALGAAKGGIVRLVVTESVRFALLGLAVGCVVSLAGSRWIAPLLFKESPRDPTVFAIVTLVLLFVAIAASWIPALRAAGLDPKTALQSD